ncbi:DUF262 domain-containing protein [Paenibacillus sp. PDC88]|uniref:DUF262 domain-containing protein n=1 Tax=Paenibacillus sp. PDC88 TaxID=1884375 RepID=UPI000895239E|nr:DUF262 domain-containing protein [Paenibacillus sp. PDC88]SDX43236.1 Protein of unknown function DUF262 [Paenibacillus sp. PDC88]
MQFKFQRNTLNIKEIYDDFKDEKLVIDNSYQRRKVWMKRDNVRLIETILLNWIIPEIFLWPAEINPDTGDTVTHIVDGQQRINAIIDFISGEYKLQERYLLSEPDVRGEFTNKKFSELSPELKKNIWMYNISIVNIDRKCTIQDIKHMFYRLNLTDYSLNEQEKRNSLDNEFGNVSKELANDEFWEKHKVFSASDIKRMKDIEYCSNIIILVREGIVDQTSSKKLNETYDDLKYEYLDKDNNIKLVNLIMDVIDAFKSKDSISFLNKKSQMYTMFCVGLEVIENKIDLTDNIVSTFNSFVRVYNKFKNGMDLTFEESLHSELFEAIKKYKLASSEGVNKLSNRVIRFEILMKHCIKAKPYTQEALKHIEKVIDNLQSNDNDYSTVEEDEEEE